MTQPRKQSISRRRLLTTAGACAAGVGAAGLGLIPSTELFGGVGGPRPDRRAQDASGDGYFPPAEREGGWRVGDPGALGVDAARLREAVAYHDTSGVTTSHGGALVIVHQGHLISETYVTGTEGGPQPWTAGSCNDMKSSTKSVFGTAVGVFLDEYADRVTLDTLLVGASRDESLIPQIWEQSITDERKTRIRVKHAISMTSGHESREPWLAPAARHRHPGYSGAYQMYEYCFGWWEFEGIPAHHTLMFDPGADFNYSNFGLEQMALAMRNVSGEQVGPYVYDRVLGPIGMARGIRDTQYRDMPYADNRELNFSDDPGWGVGGSTGCDAYGADGSASPFGYNSVVGSTFRCTARDFARLGYLWLRRGRWGQPAARPGSLVGSGDQPVRPGHWGDAEQLRLHILDSGRPGRRAGRPLHVTRPQPEPQLHHSQPRPCGRAAGKRQSPGDRRPAVQRHAHPEDRRGHSGERMTSGAETADASRPAALLIEQ